ncbi:MAG: O-antigen ligase family protein [Comamonadaceae bacterium]|nr:O-antigen ligase family protein [Comamonadaceae bacterium]
MTTEHSIILGYVMAIAIGVSLYMTLYVTKRQFQLVAFSLLLGGIVAAFSRGPWVGAAAILFIYFVLEGKRGFKKIATGILLIALGLFILTVIGWSEKILSYMPFIGSVDSENVDYRKRLFEVSMDRIYENPWLGSSDYLSKMEEMRQGQGIIDLVNTYLVVSLNSGLVGLSLFVLFFFTTLIGVSKVLRNKIVPLNQKSLGNVLFSTMMGILLTIFTCSPMSLVPLMYWLFSSLCLVYVKLNSPPNPQLISESTM